MAQGFGIQEGLMLRNAIVDIKEQRAEASFDKEYKTHLGGIQSDPQNYKPAGDYDPKAFNQARMEHMTLALKDQQVQKGVFEHQREVIDAQFEQSQAFSRQAQAANAAKDLGSELKAYEMAYENVFDGMDMQIGSDQKSYTLVDKLTGEETIKTFKDSETMVRTMRAMSDQMSVSGMFAQTAMQSRMQRAMINAEQEWTPLVNEKGAKAWTTKQYNNDTGQVDTVYEIRGQRVPAEEVRKLGFTTPKTEKTLAEASKARATGKAAGIKARKDTTGKITPHAEEKLTDFYHRLHGVSKIEASRMVREDKAKGRIAQDMEAFMSDEMLDPSDPEDSKTIKAKRKALQELYAPTMPSGKKARGLPKEEKITGTVPTDRLPSPKGLKDGQTAGGSKYIIRNGKWALATK